MKIQNISLIIIGIVLFSACNSNNNKQTSKTMETQNTEIKDNNEAKISLSSLLSEKKQLSTKKSSETKKKIYAEGIEAVAKSGVLDNALSIGDTASNFLLHNQNGTQVTLYDELKKGPVVLTWYRGGWCPYCNISLQYLQQKLPEFQAAGASLIALTPELPDSSLNTTEKHGLEFQVLSDVDNVIGKQFGVIFKLTPEVATIYQKAFGLHEYNGNDSNELPLAATYVIDSNGIIQYAFLDADYRNRAEPDEIIKALNKIN